MKSPTARRMKLMRQVLPLSLNTFRFLKKCDRNLVFAFQNFRCTFQYIVFDQTNNYLFVLRCDCQQVNNVNKAATIIQLPHFDNLIAWQRRGEREHRIPPHWVRSIRSHTFCARKANAPKGYFRLCATKLIK